MRFVFVVWVCVGLAAAHAAELMENNDARAQRIVQSAPFKATVASFEANYDRFVNEIIQLTEIPAPPFQEKIRGEAFAQMLREAGLENVETDAVGNVMALRKGKGGAPLLAIAAHL